MKPCKSCGATKRNAKGKCILCARVSTAKGGKKLWRNKVPCRKCHSTDRNPSGGCRACMRANSIAFVAANREKVRAQARARYARNPLPSNASSAAWRKNNPARVKTNNVVARLRNYGLTLSGWDELLLAQSGRCWLCGRAICEVPHVDHDHTTGKVRGLTHAACNKAFGLLNEDPAILYAIAQRAAEIKSCAEQLVKVGG